MGKIHRAFYGERGGGHDLLSTTDPNLSAVREALGATDRPSAGPGNWSPYVSGMPFGSHYALMRTFPAPRRAGGRGGFVFTHALFIERSDVSAVSDLRVFLDLLGAEMPTDTSLIIPFPAPSSVAPPTFPEDPRIRAAARHLLARGDSARPVVWLGESGFEDVLARIWSGLWVEARMALRFRASFDPTDAERGDMMLVCTPELSRARWTGFPLIDLDASVADATPAERLLAGEPSPLSEFIEKVRPRAPSLRILRQAEAAADLLASRAALPPQRHVRLLRLLVAIGPEAEMAVDEKTQTAAQIAAAIRTSDAAFAHSLRNLVEAPLGSTINSLRDGIEKWAQAHFTKEANAVGAWLHEEAEPWWIQSVRRGVERAVCRWNREVAKALWTFWAANPDDVGPLCALAAGHADGVEEDLAATCPSTLAPQVAERITAAARAQHWPVVLGLSLAAAHGARVAFEKLLNAFAGDVADALDAIVDRYGGTVLVESALIHDDPRLTDTAASLISREPALLSMLDPDIDAWRNVWLRAIEFGGDAWAGVPEPSTVRDRILDRVLRQDPVEPALLEALARTPLADVDRYPRRVDLWTVLPEPARRGFLGATAAAWIARFWSSPDSAPIPEDPVLSLARTDPRLLEGDTRDPARALHAGVMAFERLTGWHENELLGWLQRMGPMLSRLPSADAARLGQIVAAQQWKRVAADLYARRNTLLTLRAAIPAVLPLLNTFQQWMAGFEGIPWGVHHVPDWYDALFAAAVHLYPQGPDQQRIWERSGGDSSLIEGWSGRDRWYSALSLLRSGGAGQKVSAQRLTTEMVHDFNDNVELRALHETAP